MNTLTTLSCGDGPIARSILFARDVQPGDVDVRFQCWCVSTGDQLVLIDAGVPAGDPRLAGVRDLRMTGDLLDVDPRSVTDVVLTHLHWDHVGDIELFCNAAVHVQVRELELLGSSWMDRVALRGLFASTDKLDWIADNPRLRPIALSANVAPGIEVDWVGGHTPGSQIVQLELNEQKVVFTGDVVNRLRNLDDDVPPGLLWSLPEALAALDRIRELRDTGWTIAPSHEAVLLPG